MTPSNIEARLERFMEHADYERALDALYNVTLSAFLAGWLAAGQGIPAFCRPNPKDGGTNTIKY